VLRTLAVPTDPDFFVLWFNQKHHMDI